MACSNYKYNCGCHSNTMQGQCVCYVQCNVVYKTTNSGTGDKTDENCPTNDVPNYYDKEYKNNADNKTGKADFCAKYEAGITYTCSGHRKINEKSPYSINWVRAGSIISSESINQLQNAISSEIRDRRKHIFYKNDHQLTKNYTADLVLSGDVVKTSQPNTIRKYINNLYTAITDKNNELGDYHAGTDLCYNEVASILKNDIISNDIFLIQYNQMNDRNYRCVLSNMGRDCICYSDCTEFANWYSYGCMCNIDCKCNYS